MKTLFPVLSIASIFALSTALTAAPVNGKFGNPSYQSVARQEPNPAPAKKKFRWFWQKPEPSEPASKPVSKPDSKPATKPEVKKTPLSATNTKAGEPNPVQPTPPKRKKFRWFWQKPEPESPESKAEPKQSSKPVSKPEKPTTTQLKPSVVKPKPEIKAESPKTTVKTALPASKTKPVPQPEPASLKPVEQPKKHSAGEPNLESSLPPPPASVTTTKELKQKSKSTNELISEDAKERLRYQSVKRKAIEDPEVLKLQEQSDTASPENERAARQAYQKALFNRMRKLDPSLKDRIDRTEAALIKHSERNTVGSGE